MQFDTLTILFLIVVGIMIMIVITAISMQSGSNLSTMERARKKQLKDQEKRKVEVDKAKENKELVDRLTKPLVDNVLPRLSFYNYDRLAKELHITGWEKVFTPQSWAAMTIIMGIIGIVFFLLLRKESTLFAAIIGGIFIISPTFLLNNEYNNIKDEILMHFPETIRVITAYLSAEVTLQDAFRKAAETATERWSQILEGFAKRCQTQGEEAALEWIKQQIDILEGREFFAAVSLAQKDGLSPIKAFTSQADSIEQLLKDANQKKIEKRKVWATLLQGPLLLEIIISFCLPIVGQFIDMFGG